MKISTCNLNIVAQFDNITGPILRIEGSSRILTSTRILRNVQTRIVIILSDNDLDPLLHLPGNVSCNAGVGSLVILADTVYLEDWR